MGSDIVSFSSIGFGGIELIQQETDFVKSSPMRLGSYGLQADTSRGCTASSEKLLDKPTTFVGCRVNQYTDCVVPSLLISTLS